VFSTTATATAIKKITTSATTLRLMYKLLSYSFIIAASLN
jgi:hypothetical protein